MVVTTRTHDAMYLDENRYKEPKENFKFILKDALGFAETMPKTILDVGCAAGEFSYFLKSQLPNAQITGMDVVPELVAKARREVSGAEFKTGSVLDPAAEERTFDMVFLIGVHSIFDDIQPIIANLLQWCNPGGTVVIFGLINSYDLDVYLKVDRLKQKDVVLETGWNFFSRATFDRILTEHAQALDWKFADFEIDIDLPPNENDPLRSWTVAKADGARMIVNGMGLVHDLKNLCVRKVSN